MLLGNKFVRNKCFDVHVKTMEMNLYVRVGMAEKMYIQRNNLRKAFGHAKINTRENMLLNGYALRKSA